MTTMDLVSNNQNYNSSNLRHCVSTGQLLFSRDYLSFSSKYNITATHRNTVLYLTLTKLESLFYSVT
jgi:hypothetical protein